MKWYEMNDLCRLGICGQGSRIYKNLVIWSGLYVPSLLRAWTQAGVYTHLSHYAYIHLRLVPYADARCFYSNVSHDDWRSLNREHLSTYSLARGNYELRIFDTHAFIILQISTRICWIPTSTRLSQIGTSQPTLFDPALSLSGLKKERRRWLASDVKRYLSKDIEKMEECNKIIRLVRNDVLGIGAKLINFSTRISQFKATYFHRCIQFPMIHVRLKVMYRLHLAPISVNQTPLFLLSLPNQRPKPHPSLRVII